MNLKVIIGLLATIIMLTSCNKKQEVMLSPEEQHRLDSMALHVAVMPTLSCLPVYYAERMRMTDSLDFRLLRYNAQMDIDTALTKHHAEIAYTDLIRAIRLAESPCPVAVFMSTDEPISMVAMKGKRVKKLNQMKEKMIAVSRLSITDYWCDRMMDSARLADDQIYRPQVNNVVLRADMLRTGLMEGAMLAEPQATWMEMMGNKRLYKTGKKDFRMAAWVVADSLRKDDYRIAQMKQFVKIYRAAAERISNGEASDTIRAILMDDYRIPAEFVDSIALSAVTADKPQNIAIEEAIKWLSKRNRMPRNFDSHKFILEDE